MLPVPGERREGQLRQMEKQVLDRGVGHEPAPFSFQVLWWAESQPPKMPPS